LAGSRSEENALKVVGATSSEVFLVCQMIVMCMQIDIYDEVKTDKSGADKLCPVGDDCYLAGNP